MGYYTKFELNIIEGNDYCTNYEEEIIALSGFMAFDGETCSWYKHERDMLKYSKKFPGTVFELIGVGEDDDDMWKKYFKNGDVQISRAVITYEEYDEDKLN